MLSIFSCGCGWHVSVAIVQRRLRYLKDLNNQFHAGASINFLEMTCGVSEVDEVPRGTRDMSTAHGSKLVSVALFVARLGGHLLTDPG